MKPARLIDAHDEAHFGGKASKLAHSLSDVWARGLGLAEAPKVLTSKGSPDNLEKLAKHEADVAFSAADVTAALDKHRPDVGILTLAPELPGAMALTKRFATSGVRVSLGHSSASFEVAQAAIAMVRDPELSIAGIMKHIKGPDFPGGAQIITPRAELKEAYTSGRGSVRVRARWNIERLARGQWQLVVHELPPGVSTRKVLEEIDASTNPQPKTGKKSLTPEQTREKQLVLSMLDKARAHESWEARQAAADLPPFEVSLPAGRLLDPVDQPDVAVQILEKMRDIGATMVNVNFRHRSPGHYVEQLEALAPLARDV